MSQIPLSVVISTRANALDREIQHHYLVHTRFPRWELFRIFVRALFQIRFR